MNSKEVSSLAAHNTAQSSVIRLVLAIAMLHKFSVGSIDVVAAYLQSGHLPWRVFVRPPRGWAKSGCLWRLFRVMRY
jgi:hypothetical protein